MKICKDNWASFFSGACPKCGSMMFLDTDGKESWWAQCENHTKCNNSIPLKEGTNVEHPKEVV